MDFILRFTHSITYWRRKQAKNKLKDHLSNYSYILYVNLIIYNLYCCYKYIDVIYIYYLCFMIYLAFIDIIIDNSFLYSKFQEHINYIMLLNSLYILYAMMKTKYDFMKTTSLFEN